MAALPVNPFADALALLDADQTLILEWLGENTNGNHTYSNDRALYGFVKVMEYVMIPSDYMVNINELPNVNGTDRAFPDISIDTIGSLTGITEYLGGSNLGTTYRNHTTYMYVDDEIIREKIAFMNFVSLREGGVSVIDAFLVAALRARWIALGAWKIAMDDTTRPYAEHIVVNADPNGNIHERICAANDRAGIYACNIGYAREFLGQSRSESAGMAWVIKHAETIWAAEEYITRVRGHHYKPEYEAALRKFVNACMEGVDTIPSGISMEYLFRVAIHPFGIRALPIMTAHFTIYGKVGNAAILRLSGAPNGTAVITTTIACIRAMGGETWYDRFERIYGTRIKLLEEFEKEVLGHKFSYHISHRLYGVTSKTGCTVNGVQYTVEQMKAHATSLATFAQGFVDALKEAQASGTITSFSFSNAKVMEKASGSNPLMTIRVRGLILFTVQAIQDSSDVDSATRIALPMTSNAPAAPITPTGT